MNLILKLIDDQYPKAPITHTRLIARGVVINDNGEVALTKLLFDDIFGHRDYYELPGGGLNVDETPAQALMREMEEELGFAVEIISEIGEVSDYYNLIGRHNRNFFFLAKTIKYVGQRLEPREITRIEKVVWLPFDDAIESYEKLNDIMISGLVKRRELPILKLAKQMLIEGKF